MNNNQTNPRGSKPAQELGRLNVPAVRDAIFRLRQVGYDLAAGNGLLDQITGTQAGSCLFHLAKRGFYGTTAEERYWTCRMLIRLVTQDPEKDAVAGLIRFFEKHGTAALRVEQYLLVPEDSPQSLRSEFQALIAADPGQGVLRELLIDVCHGRSKDAWVETNELQIIEDPMFSLLVWSGATGLEVISSLLSSGHRGLLLMHALARMDSSGWQADLQGSCLEIAFAEDDIAGWARGRLKVALACCRLWEPEEMQVYLARNMLLSGTPSATWHALQIAACVPMRKHDQIQEALLRLGGTELKEIDHAIEAAHVASIRARNLLTPEIDEAHDWVMSLGK